jgi:hypothetical protein
LSALGPIAAGQHVEERGLASSVRTDDSGQLAGFDGERNVVEHDVLSEALM